jgi:hypothetical protein
MEIAKMMPIVTLYLPSNSGQAFLAGMLAVALQVGTGGEATAHYYKARGSKGYPIADYDAPSSVVTGVADRIPAEDLAQIRAVLKPAVKDLAEMIGVSRQAVYDWQGGATIASRHAERLANLARAADLFANEGLTATSQVLRRPIAAGCSFLDIVRDGGSATDAARSLIGVVRREAEQRKALEARLAIRARPVLLEDDFGVPMLDERG